MIKFLRFNKLLIVIALGLSFSYTASAQVSFSLNSSYKYLKGIDAQGLSSDWMSSNFNDDSWSTADAPFRYGDGTGGTELSDMQGSYSTIFLRTDFQVETADEILEMSLRADYDDGFVLFINGVEAVQRNAPDNRTYDALSTGLHEYGSTESITFQTENLNLVEGLNTIAVFGCNTTLSESSDFYFDMSLSAAIAVPELPELTDTLEVTFNTPSGFHDTNFTLNIQTTEPDATVVYTLDGSNPQSSSSIIEGGQSVDVVINPASSENRGITPGVVVRASVKKEGFKASLPSARTFIFLDEVSTQSDNPGGDWPTYDVNGQYIDLGVDTRVSEGSAYGSKMEEALLDIPTISVVTDNANLFDASTGIYVNALMDGREWERECSVELLNSDEEDGFSTNAGLRIRGGYSRNSGFPRHGLRLFFRSEYGASKLEYPLFQEEGADKFDKIDLRCAQNYAWSNGDNRHTYVREVFNRDTQAKMGHMYTRSRYYHLYLNGMYWGVFQTQERADAYYAKSYLGDNSEDYDVIKVGGYPSKELDATDGNLDKWEEIWNLTQQGFADNEAYFHLEGKDANGNQVKDKEVLVDIDNLIDYMINIIYSGNYDSPVSKWGGNKAPNNFYILKNRENKTEGFQFLVHDSEHTFIDMDGIPALEVNRADIGERTGDDKMEVWDFDYFHPQWLHQKLSDNAEYRLRFADRTYKHLENNGVYALDNILDRFNDRASQIEMAIIGESARWGDSQSGSSYTKDNAWIPELDNIRDNYFPYRADIVIDQLLDVGLYSNASTPSISKDNSKIEDDIVEFVDEAIISLNSSNGVIYYTTTGEDPRMVGGAKYSYAKSIENDASLTLNASAIIKARTLNGEKWSALREVKFIAEQSDFSNFKITELHYHPLDSIVGLDTIEASNYEFVEFKNTSYTNGINLSGVVIDSAINYTFPENTILAPQEYFVIAAKPKKYYDRYGLLANGNSSSSLSNGGERFQVRDKDANIIMDFIYDDDSPWPEMPDGQGPSLVSIDENPTGDPNRPSYWTSSSAVHGSPGVIDESSTLDPNSVGEQLLAQTNIYPNPTKDEIHLVWLNDNSEEFTIELYQMNGTRVFSETRYSSASYSLTSLGLNYGIYMLKITKGNLIETQKIIYTP